MKRTLITIACLTLAGFLYGALTLVNVENQGIKYGPAVKTAITTNFNMVATAVDLNTDTSTAVALGITTNYTYTSGTGATGQVWYTSGILTSNDIDIND